MIELDIFLVGVIIGIFIGFVLGFIVFVINPLPKPREV